MNRSSHKKAWALGGFLVLLLLFSLSRQPWKNFETNILMFLPPGELSQNQQLLAELDQSQGRQSNFLLCAPNFNQTQAAARLSLESLKTSGLFAKIQGQLQGDYASQMREFYQAYPGIGINEEIRKILTQPQTGSRLWQRQQKLLTQVGAATGGLQSDPLLLKSQFPDLANLRFGAFFPQQDWLTLKKGKESCIFLSAENREEAFDVDYQTQFLEFHDQWQAQISQHHPQTKLITLSLVRFAALSRQEIQKDLTMVTLLSLTGIFLLLKFIFPGFRPLWAGQIPLLIGAICGFSATLLIYPKIHLIALALGATLTGVAIDYVFHYLVQWRFQHEDWDPQQALEEILPGLNLGLITSLLGYTGFFFAPIEGIQQTAVFALFGLTGAYVGLRVYFPLIFKNPAAKPSANFLPGSQKVLTHWARFGLPLTLLLVVVAGIYLCFGLPKVNDDIRKLNSLSAELKAEAGLFARLSQMPDPSRFLLVSASDPESLLQRSESLIQGLKKLQREGKISGYLSAIELIPSQQRQEENFQATKKALNKQLPYLETNLLELGFAAKDLQKYFAQWETEPKLLTLPPWLAHPLSAPWQTMWLLQKDQAATAVYLGSDFDSLAVQALVEEMQGVVLMDRAETISQAFGKHRTNIVAVLLGAYLLIFYLLWVNLGLKDAFWISLPPLAGAINLLAWLKFMNLEINLFHLLAMILILGVGIDYSIFYYHSGKQALSKTTIAVFASLLTTLLAFGALGLSSVPPLQAIGLSLLIGLCSAFLISSISRSAHRGFLPPMPRFLHWIDRGLRRSHNLIFCGLAFVLFAVGGLIIANLLFPLVYLFSKDRISRQANFQYLIYLAFRSYYIYLNALGLIRGEFMGLEHLEEVKDKKLVIVANHPALLDFVLLASALPKVVCLVKGEVWVNPFLSKLARGLGYIPFQNGQEAIDLSVTRLEEGFPILIFPEGSRSPVNGLGKFSKGAAYVALSAGAHIMPVTLTLSDPILMKGWKWWQVMPHKVTMTAQFHPAFPTQELLEECKGETPLASRKLTGNLMDFFSQALHNQPQEELDSSLDPKD